MEQVKSHSINVPFLDGISQIPKYEKLSKGFS